MAMFDDAEVGDKVWSVVEGWGVVKEIHKNSNFPLLVSFKSRNFSCGYTFEGKSSLVDNGPSLFWKEQTFDLSRPKWKADWIAGRSDEGNYFFYNNISSKEIENDMQKYEYDWKFEIPGTREG